MLLSIVEASAVVAGIPRPSHGTRLWQNESIMAAIRFTAIVGGLSVALASVLAVILALYVHSDNAFGRRFLELTVYLPFLLPPIVTGLALLMFFAQAGVSRGVVTVVVGHMVFVLAVIYRLVLTRLQSLPASLVEASSDLGATRWFLPPCCGR